MPQRAFVEKFGSRPTILVRAPGRVNLIGDHTDYNGGYVLPMAIDRAVRIACRPTGDGKIELDSLDFNQQHTFDLEELKRDSDEAKANAPDWARYFMGVAYVLQQKGHVLSGLQAVLKGDVPIGAGLSSSAAMEAAAAMALCSAANIHINRETLARICRRAENDFVGVNCGIMDQFASFLCRENTALLIDCTAESYNAIHLGDVQAKVVVCNSRVDRALSDSPYNARRQECVDAFKILCRHIPDIATYRDISMEALKSCETLLPEPLNRRARHVVSENTRVLYAAQALKEGDLITFGSLMDASHESLKHDCEVSCAQLDTLVELARLHHGTYGARMTGAGFGGCIVALVRSDTVEEFTESVSSGYAQAAGHAPDIYVFRPSEGATVTTD